MRGRAYLNPTDFLHKLREQENRCSDCKEPFTDEMQDLSGSENPVDFIEINGEAYNLVYKRKRNEGGKNEPDNIKITCSKCQITTKIVTARLPIMLVERMDKEIEYENSPGNRKRRYGRSDFVKDSIEATLSYKKVDWPGKIASTKGNMGIFSSHVMASKGALEQVAHESGVLIEIKKIVKNLYSSDSSELDSKNQEQNTDNLDEMCNALLERLEDEQKQREARLMEIKQIILKGSIITALENLKEELSTIDYPLDEVISTDEDKDE